MTQQNINPTDLEQQLYVSKIVYGFVVDHIDTKYEALKIVQFLGLDKKAQDASPSPRVLIAMNVPSARLGKKHIIKVERFYPSPYAVNFLGLLEPGVTVNFIQDRKVILKYRLTPPEYFEGIVRCSNFTCITNYDLKKDGTINPDATPEPITTRFELIKKGNRNVYRCCWCNRFQDYDMLKRVRPEVSWEKPRWVQSPLIPLNITKKHSDFLKAIYNEFMKGDFSVAGPYNLDGYEVAFWKIDEEIALPEKIVYLTLTEEIKEQTILDELERIKNQML